MLKVMQICFQVAKEAQAHRGFFSGTLEGEVGVSDCCYPLTRVSSTQGLKEVEVQPSEEHGWLGWGCTGVCKVCPSCPQYSALKLGAQSSARKLGGPSAPS